MSVILPGGLRVYSCADWGAKPPLHAFANTTPRNMVVHHMDYPNRDLIADSNAAIQAAFALARRCQAQHMAQTWADTGQHFTISRDGIILEGRHGSLAALQSGRCIRAAHAADDDVSPKVDDNDSWGVEHEGTYSTVEMPSGQWNASVQLYAAIAFLCKLDTALIIGHRDTGCSTACPGNWLESQLPQLRVQAHNAKLKLIS